MTTSLSLPSPSAFKSLLLGQQRSRPTSEVRLRALVVPETVNHTQAHGLLDDVGGDQLTLSLSLVCLERAVELVPYDPAAQAATRVLRARIEELGELRDALQRVHFACVYPMTTCLLVKDAPLGDYLRGLHAWLAGTVRALEYLAVELRQLETDWSSLRARLDAAASFHLDGLADEVRADVARVAANEDGLARDLVEELAWKLEDLFACAEWFSVSIRQRFG